MKEQNWIYNNPFYLDLPNYETSIWVLENEYLVKRVISSILIKTNNNHFLSEIDEIFSTVYLYFLENKDREFDKNYYQKLKERGEIQQIKEEVLNRTEEDSKKAYILNMVYYITLNYIQDLYKTQTLLKFIPNDEYYNYNYPFTVSQDKIKEGYDYQLNKGNPEVYCYEIYLQDMLENDLHVYDQEFQEKGLMSDFSTRKFVESTFLKSFGGDEEKIAEDLGVSLSEFNIMLKKFKKIIKNNPDHFIGLQDIIYELIQGVKQGWEPIFIEQEDKN